MKKRVSPVLIVVLLIILVIAAGGLSVVIGGIFIVVSTIINQFVLSIIGIGLKLLGLPTYYYMQKKNN